MRDTSKSMTDHFKKMIMARSPSERLLMGCSMYDTARQISESAIRNKNPRISSAAMKKAIFLRFYGKEFIKERGFRVMRGKNLY